MKRKKKNYSKDNLKPILIFCLLVLSLVIISLLFKAATLIKSSRFDGKHSFNAIVYSNKENQSAQKKMVISFSPDTQSISVLKVLTDVKPSNLGRVLEIPVDGTIGVSGQNEQKLESMFQTMLLNYKDIDTKLTIIDIFRLWFFTRGITEQAITTKELFLPNEAGLKDEVIDRISSKLFLDMTFSQEKVSIQIVNGTGVLGLGNRLGRLIQNIGGNVVAVSTAEDNFETSEILYFDQDTYALQRLSGILGFKKNQARKIEVSDIIIKIGRDSLSFLVF